MNLKLTRKTFALYGVTGVLTPLSGGDPIAFTLEHAYPDQGGKFVPKLASGAYTCIRHAPNRLPYETFMVQDVPAFQGSPVSGILIHIGNYNNDSEGCILLGTHLGPGCILDSRVAFEQFMRLQEGADKFELIVTD